MIEWWDYLWGGLLVAGVGFEIWAAAFFRTATLTVLTRKIFHTEKKDDSTLGETVGRIVFLAIWVPFAVWFTGHIAFRWPP